MYLQAISNTSGPAQFDVVASRCNIVNDSLPASCTPVCKVSLVSLAGNFGCCLVGLADLLPGGLVAIQELFGLCGVAMPAPCGVSPSAANRSFCADMQNLNYSYYGQNRDAVRGAFLEGVADLLGISR